MARVLALIFVIAFAAVKQAESVTLTDCQGYFTTVKGCLLSNFGPFFTDAAATACNGKKINQTLFAAFKEYILMNLFDPVSQKLNLALPTQVSKLSPAACMTSCMFKNQGLFYTNNSINYANFNKLITRQSVLTATTKGTLQFNADYCQPITTAGKLQTIGSGSTSCLIKPLLHLQCVREALLSNVGASFTSTIPCRLAIINIRNCGNYTAATWNV